MVEEGGAMQWMSVLPLADGPSVLPLIVPLSSALILVSKDISEEKLNLIVKSYDFIIFKIFFYDFSFFIVFCFVLFYFILYLTFYLAFYLLSSRFIILLISFMKK